MKLYATLYHGSSRDIDEIDLARSASSGLEFGAGFYTTPDLETARRYAQESSSVSPGTLPTIIEYEFDEGSALLGEDIDVRKFDRFDLEWFNYVSDNLHDLEFHSGSSNDIIIGPLEQRDAWKILKRYSERKITYENAVSKLTDIHFEMQVVFKTSNGLKYLHKVSARSL